MPILKSYDKFLKESQMCVGLIFLVLTACLIGGFSRSCSMKEVRVEAVKAGVADWKVDEKGNVRFEWKRSLDWD